MSGIAFNISIDDVHIVCTRARALSHMYCDLTNNSFLESAIY